MDEEGLLVGPISPEKNYIHQEALSGSNYNTSTPSKAQPKDISPSTGDLPRKTTGEEKQINETIKSLTERLSAALLTINAKEELVKQHAKVAEEAVAGWERAETEVANLKQNLESISRKNISLESQITNLDTALKECVRQLRQSREENSQKIQESLSSKSRELESQIQELRSRENEIRGKLRVKEKENTDLKADIELLQLERDLSNEAAESASRQNLENIKKITKIEAECRRLRALNSRSKIAGNLNCVESLTDSHSDVGLTDSETGQPDNWGSALISELDLIKTGTNGMKSLTNCLVDIDLMDDFLEMERLAGLNEVETGQMGSGDGSVKDEMEALREKLENVEREKVELKKLLEGSRNQAELSESKLLEAEFQLDLVKESQRVCLIEIENLVVNKNDLEFKLEKEILQVDKLKEEVSSLEEKIEGEKILYKSKLEEKIKALEKSNLEKVKEERVKLEEFRGKSEKEISLLEKSYLEKMGSLKEKIKEERAKSEEIRAKLEVQIKSLEENLKKERVKLEEIKGKLENQTKSLEENLKKERTKSEEIKSKLETQIKSLEENLKKERAKSEEIKIKFDTKIKSLEKSNSEKLKSAEENLKEERAKLGEFNATLKNYETQLEMANLEVCNLKNNLRFLEGKIEKERLLSEEYETKCRKLEAQMERQPFASPNGEPKIKQEKEIVMAGKLEECQKTIASLNQQLKSLTSLDEEIIIDKSDDESVNPNLGLDGELGLGLGLGLDSADDFAHDLIRFTRVNGNGQLQFSSVLSSPFSGFARNNSHIE